MKSPINFSRTPYRKPHTGGAGGANAHENSASFAPFTPLASQMISFDTLATLASRMSDGVCFLTADGRIRYANPALRELLGRSEAELLGKRIDEFRQVMYDAPDGVNHEPSMVSEHVKICQWRRGDGDVFEARCAVEPLVGGSEQGGSLLLMTPITRSAQSGEQNTELDESERLARQAERAAAGRWIEVIEAVTDVTLTRLPINDLIEAMLNRIRLALDLENAGVFLINAEGDALEAHAVAGAGREFASDVRVPLEADLLQGAMSSHEPVIVNEAGELLRESGLFPEPLLASMTIHSMLLTPLIVEGQVIGLLYLGAREPDHFTVDDIRLARVAGARAALAVEGARAREEVARGQRRLVTLAEASGMLVGPLNHTAIATLLVSLVAPAFVDACALYLVEEDGAIRQAAVSELAVESEGEISEPVLAAVAHTLQRLPQELESLDPPLETLGQGKAPARLGSAITRIAVETHGHPVGALYLIEGIKGRLALEDLTLIKELAGRAAVGMEIARLYADLEQALRRVSESAIQLDTIFDSTDASIYVTDATGRFMRINTYGAHMLGIRDPSVISAWNQPHAASELRDERGNYIPPEESPIHIARTRNIAIERRVTIHRFDTGEDVPALARCTPMRDGRGQVIGAVGVLMDITGINEIERQKDEFLGIVSHELKTPLTTLKILSQMLTRRMRASDEPRALEQAERMTTAIVRMERLINDLLDVSRIQEGKLTLTMAVSDLGAICRDAASEQEIVSQRPIHLLLPDRESLPVHADTERLRQVVVNLLSNALKYSPANMPVSLRVREANEQYLISVEDHGPGLPLEERRRLFQRFYRAPSVQVQSGSGVGLGLGLFISREIVRNHGGEIWVESEPGHGSVFTFSIPRAGHGDSPGSDGDDTTDGGRA